jgi:dienelactone hydrolase
MYTALMALVLYFLLLAGCVPGTSSLTLTTTRANGTVEQIPAMMLKPEGPGPFPAVVIMHDCSGLGPRSSGSPIRWARGAGGERICHRHA